MHGFVELHFLIENIRIRFQCPAELLDICLESFPGLFSVDPMIDRDR